MKRPNGEVRNDVLYDVGGVLDVAVWNRAIKRNLVKLEKISNSSYKLIQRGHVERLSCLTTATPLLPAHRLKWIKIRCSSLQAKHFICAKNDKNTVWPPTLRKDRMRPFHVPRNLHLAYTLLAVVDGVDPNIGGTWRQ